MRLGLAPPGREEVAPEEEAGEKAYLVAHGRGRRRRGGRRSRRRLGERLVVVEV